MLVCPHCQFENPDHHKFCQSCGNTLRVWQAVVTLCRPPQTSEPRERMAPLAQADADPANQPPGKAQILDDRELSDLEKITKEASTGNPPSVKLATWPPEQVFRSAADSSGNSVDNEPVQLASTVPATEKRFVEAEAVKQQFNLPEDSSRSNFKAPTLFPDEAYLDPKQRYQLREPPPSLLGDATEFEIGVIDCRPAEPSPLENIHEQFLAATTEVARLDVSAISGLPTSAQPYLLLQHRLFPAIPELHNAWQDDERTVLILEDRLHLPLLFDFWKENDIEPLQQVHLLYEMTELWEALVAWEGQPSLINLENLRVDEDQILCLRRLYFQPSGSIYTLKDLGLLWQSLLQESQNFPLTALVALASRLGNKEIQTIEAVQSYLAKLADTLQFGEANSRADNDCYADNLTAKESAASVVVDVDSALNSSLSEIAAIPPDRAAGDEIDYAVELSQLNGDEWDEEGADSGDATDLPTMVLPMNLVGLDEEGRTHIGRQRDHNEDTFCILTELKRQEGPDGQTLHARGLYILCDGMGGHAGGEIASALAAKTLQAYFKQHWQDQLPSEDNIREAIGSANQAIFEINQQNDRSGSGRMGTTLVMTLFQDTRVIVAHVGDSRLYRFSRRLGLQQVTVDHEVGQREIQRGVESAIAYARPDAYQLTQALGPRDQNEIKPSISFLDLSEDTLLILCSDGLSDNELLETYCDSHIKPLLGSRFSLEEGVSNLIELANEINGHDNITAITARFRVRPNLEKMKPSQH